MSDQPAAVSLNKPNTHYRAIEKHIEAISQIMMDCNAQQRRRLDKQLHNMTTTNCWWAMYDAKILLLQLLANIQFYERKTRKAVQR